MQPAIDAAIDIFERFVDCAPKTLKIERPAPFTLGLIPEGSGGRPSNGKRWALTLMGLTHGNEVAGVSVLNGILAHVLAGTLTLTRPLLLILGNPWAARENKRFLDRDLNRSFRAARRDSREARRASELEPLLAATSFLVDFHQVTRPCDRSFFIFPFRRASYEFAKAIAPWQTIVTHWKGSFSAEGMCTDEFVNDAGGVGISLELGQNGFDQYQIAVGIQCALWALHAIADSSGNAEPATRWRLNGTERADLFTWAGVMPWPDAGIVTLVPGLDNFSRVEQGQRVGDVDGLPLVCPFAGQVLFAKYLSPDQQRQQPSRPTELMRVMRPLVPADLPS